jgi:hypothetical protein
MDEVVAGAAFTYAIDSKRGVVVLTYARQPTYTEWQRLMSTVVADAQYRPGLSIVSDRRALTDAVSPGTVERMSEYVATHAGQFARCRWAVVVRPTQLAEYGMARVGQVLFGPSGVELQVFTDFEEAMAWAAAGP